MNLPTKAEGTLAVRALEGQKWQRMGECSMVKLEIIYFGHGNIMIKTRETRCGRRPWFDLSWFVAWGSFGKKHRKFKLELNQNMNEVFLMGIFVYSDAGGVRQAHLSPYAHDETLSEKLYIYVYTHIHIYTYTQVTTCCLWIQLLKNTDCFTTIAPLTFIIIHSKIFNTHGRNRKACIFYVAQFFCFLV